MVPVGIMPFTPSVGVMANITPLQVVTVIALIDAAGLIVTVTVKVAPVQLPDNGVTVYVAVNGEFAGLISVPLIFVAFVAAAPPVKPPVTSGAGQLYTVPAGITPSTPFVGLTVNNITLQILVVICVTVAIGLIVTVTVNAAPVQLPDKGVTT